MNSLTTLVRSSLRSVRTMGIATAVAGVAVVGLSSGAPAFAAPAAPAAPTAGPAAHGPDAFLRGDYHGVVPVFFCDPAKPHKHHNTAKPQHQYKCVDLSADRF